MNVRGIRRLLAAVLASAVCVALAVPAGAGAGAATVVNGDFESGSLKGWSVHRATTAGNWFAYKNASEPIANKRGKQPIQPPPQGNYAAIADQLNPDTLILSQDVALEAGATHFLSLLAYYSSYAPLASPDTLSVDAAELGGQANQQFRIDVMRPQAQIESVNPADVLATVFRTQAGGPEIKTPAQLTADLSAFAGQTVRLRIAVAAGKEVLAAGVDSVAITAKPPGPGGPDGKPKRFRLGKAKANPKNGTVTLSVEVPGAGKLTAASAAKAAKAPKPVRRAQLKARAAGTVKLRLKPSAAGLAILREEGKLRARVAVSFKGGSLKKTATKAVVFRLAPRR
ncbi:MAG TPA: hypothetical protein VFY48_05040 [Solirubrobacterales bacterium]|nr:hypothetical protein [Solirubrobacterales bacterium]